MKKAPILSVVVMLMIVLVPGANLASAAPPMQQAPPACPKYNQTNLTVDFVNSVPNYALVGDTVVTTFHVIYADGTPVTLEPLTASFNWTGPSGSKEYDLVPVVSNGTAGFYTYTQPFTQDIIQATGFGTITIFVVFCSLSDGSGNRGPTAAISSIQTLIPTDNSQLSPTEPAPPLATNNYVPSLLIVVLLILALLIVLLRRRKTS